MAARSMPERDRIWPATEHPHPSDHPLALSPNLELRAHRAPGRRVSSRVGADLRHRQDLRTRDQRSPWARDSGDPGSGSAPWRSTSTGSDARTATAPRPPRSCHRGRTRPSGHPAMSGGIRSQRLWQICHNLSPALLRPGARLRTGSAWHPVRRSPSGYPPLRPFRLHGLELIRNLST